MSAGIQFTSREFGGSGVGNMGQIHTDGQGWDGQPASAALTLPPLAVLWFTRRGRTPTGLVGRFLPALAISAPVMVLLGNSMGWIFTEMGRQPWVVFGVLTTANGVSPGDRLSIIGRPLA